MQERILEFIVPFLEHYGYLTLLVVTFLETSAFLGLVAPGETIIVLCGFYAFRGVLDPYTVTLVAIAGAFAGDQVGYWVGRRFGRGFLHRFGRYFLFDAKRIAATERYYDRHGAKTVFVGRFMSILRSFGPVVAGASRMSYGSFLVWSFLSCIVWGATFSLLGYFFGASWDVMHRYLGWGGAIAFVLGVVIVIWALHRKREDQLEQEMGA